MRQPKTTQVKLGILGRGSRESCAIQADLRDECIDAEARAEMLGPIPIPAHACVQDA